MRTRTVLAEAPDSAEAQHVEVAVVGFSAEVAITLPFRAQSQRGHHVPLGAAAERQAVARVLGRRAGVGLEFRLAAMSAQLGVDAELVGDGQNAHADEFPGVGLDVCAAAGSANTAAVMPSTATADFICCSPLVE